MSRSLDLQSPSRPSIVATALLGRTFVHPLFDSLFIGGALSLIVVGVLLANPSLAPFTSAEDFRYFILFFNSAHFAASTVRLYTKPDARHALPVVKWVLPVVALALVTLCMFRADSLGANLRALYLTWSPYHYAAQAYGLAVMYSYRSGCLLNATNKRLLWWAGMLPFFYSFLLGPQVGLHWLDVAGWLDAPIARTILGALRPVLPWAAFAAVPLLYWQVRRTEDRAMPLIAALALVTNGIWWFVFTPLQAFVWATIFHSIQYLAIVIIFHVKDQMNQPTNRHGAAYHVAWFYGMALLLGYALFNWFPQAYVSAGFAPATAVMITVAMINIHHFIVDGFIWRLKKTDANRSILESASTAPA
ncbi:MAG TPA: hypothetical protein ENI85_04275 [Deltaproteobacteria bacterium]|nr:hypothetical protein [Deltaproteobacteria bacterium]